MLVSIALIADKIDIELCGTVVIELKTDTVAEMDIDNNTVTIYTNLISFLLRFSLRNFLSHY